MLKSWNFILILLSIFTSNNFNSFFYILEIHPSKPAGDRSWKWWPNESQICDSCWLKSSQTSARPTTGVTCASNKECFSTADSVLSSVKSWLEITVFMSSRMDEWQFLVLTRWTSTTCPSACMKWRNKKGNWKGFRIKWIKC